MNLSLRTRFIPLFFIFIMAGSLPVVAADLSDWTIEDVLAKVLESNGGEEGVEGLKNVRIRGEVVTEDSAYDFMILKKRPDFMRMRFMYRGKAIETGYDGTIGWRRTSNGGIQEVSDITGEQLKTLKIEADFDGPLIGEPGEGTVISLEKIERIDRVDYFVVKVSTGFRENYHYLDSRTFRELKVVSNTIPEEGEPTTSVSFYTEYDRHGTIWVAHQITRHLPDSTQEIIQIEDVELNPGLLDLVFKKPE